MKNNLLFFFSDFNEVYSFLYKVSTLTLSPYSFYPISLISPIKKTILPFSLFCQYFKKYKHKYYRNSYLHFLKVNLVKKIIVSMFLFFCYKINQV